MALESSFNPNTAVIFQRTGLVKSTVALLRVFKPLFMFLSVVLLGLFLFGFLGDAFSERGLSLSLGSFLIVFSLFISFWYKDLFFRTKLKNPRLQVSLKEVLAKPSNFNLADFLSFEVALAVKKAIGFRQKRGFAEINSTQLLYFLLQDNKDLNFVFSRALLDIKEVKKLLEAYFNSLKKSRAKAEVYSQDFQDSVLLAINISERRGHSRVEVGDMLLALAEGDLIFQKILIDNKLQAKDIDNLTLWLEGIQNNMARDKRWWAKENLIKLGSMAKQWTAGYTVNLDRFSVDLTEVVKKKRYPEVIGHKKEIRQIERVLARGEVNNVLVIGEPGTGRKSIVQGLAVRSALGNSLSQLNNKRVVALDIPAILSYVSSKEEAQAILDKIFQEVVYAGNVILSIDNFHNFVRADNQPGLIDISGILSSYLDNSRFQLIAISTYEGLHKYIERKVGALDLFEKVEVSEITEQETLMFLKRLALWQERKHRKLISYPALREIIRLADRYLPATPYPKKAVGLLDELMVYVSSIGDKVVLPEHVATIISEKSQIPVGEVEVKEKEILLNLESLIHKRLINQEEAVKEVSAALRRARAEVTSKKGPMGTFLFLGPTGVGKTETAKALTEIYFGDERRMLRFDMSEFQSVGDVSRLIGSTSENGVLTTQVRENPFSLVLLDEIEKAHTNILNLFLQVLDEGFLTDGLGRKVDFKNTIIIATSNAGYQLILQALKEKSDWSLLKEKILEYLFAESIFRPELINRFDAMVLFKALSRENLFEISGLMLKGLQKNLKEKGVELVITPSLKTKIVELGYDPTFGAREMKRVIQDKVENVLASGLLSGQIKRGDRIKIDPEEFKLIVG